MTRADARDRTLACTAHARAKEPVLSEPLIEGIATCPDDHLDVVAAELRALGAQDVTAGYRAVTFSSSPAVFYALHLHLRTASRVLRVLASVPARDLQELFANTRALPFPSYFRPEHTFLVEGVPGGRGAEGLRPIDIAKVVKDGVQHSFDDAGLPPPRVDLEAPKAVLVAFLREGRCLLSFDTCGKALHKRGYRGEGHPAPLKETMAAAILALAGYDGSEPLVDPMCGSGTLAIEAAMLAYRKPPQIHRKKGQFLLEWQKDFDHALWRQVQDEARAARRLDDGPGIYASDLQPRFVDLARESALRARVEKHILFGTGDFADLEPPAPSGLLVANLPYGERLHGRDVSTPAFFEKVGAVLKQHWAGWRAALLIAEAAPYKAIGLRPTRRIPLLNGNIPCKLLLFELYAGSRRTNAD